MTALNDRWLINLTKARRNNQKKLLSSDVLYRLRDFIVR